MSYEPAKRCSCGESFGRVGWARLRLVGRQGDLELRDCPSCASVAP